MTEQPTAPNSKPSHYVGIGASAGGLEAIESFFTHTPPETGFSFIVVQHLSPDYKSLMVELLSKKTSMRVHRAEDGMTVEVNHVYLIPPKKNLTIFHGRLLLSEQDHSKGINLPIDVFLRSLAEDQGEKSVGIVLSGTGSDGMRGVRAIKEAGGMVMVQDEESAKFDGMPRAAISTGLADFVLAPDKMPTQLMHFAKHPFMAKSERSETLLSDEDGLTRIFAILREKCKVDFTYYKPSTVTRRIERRITVNQCEDIREYVAHLQSSPSEVHALYRELLIGVTSFFRDQGAFDRLEGAWLPELFKNHPSREMRFWVAGCSTGEEAYTLAIQARECMEQLRTSFDVKIFATDIDRNSVHVAASGTYPESIAADLSPRLLAKYFYRRDDNFQIARTIREMVVFAQHNLIKDPPFTNIDLISCRNLLIYLQPILQKKVLELFNFSLAPSGLLLLGTSETTGEMSDYFEPLDHKFKIYRSKGRQRHITEPVTLLTGAESRFHEMRQRYAPGRRALRLGDEERVLDRFLQSLAGDYIPLSLVVNEQLEVLHVVGDTEGFFKLPSGKVVNDISKMVAKDLAIPLSTGIQKVFRTRQEFRFSNIKLRHTDGDKVIEMRLKPLPEKKGQEPLVAVMLGQVKVDKVVAASEAHSFDLSQEAEQHIRDLEQELQFTKENLQATIEELETANEELQATNEELLASNEELQSTNEELQSTNEELHTVNTEYQGKIIELTELHNDVNNLLASTRIGQLLLDENLEIRRFSTPITDIFKVLDSDVGRPLTHLSHFLIDVDPIEVVRQVQRSSTPIEREVRSQNGRWYLMRVLPYHVGPRDFSGVVMVFVDVSESKHVEQALRESEGRLRLAHEAALAGAWEWDLHTGANHWSEETWRLYGLEPYSRQPDYQTWLETIHPEDRERAGLAVRRAAEQGVELNAEWRVAAGEQNGARWLMSRGQPRRDDLGKVVGYVGIVMDITQRKQAEEALRASEDKYRELFENMASAVAVYKVVDDGADFIFAAFNQAGERIEKINREQILGRRLTEAFPGAAEFGLLEALSRVWRSGQSEHFPLGFYKDKRISGWRDNYLYRLKTGEVVAVYNDHTEQKQSEEARVCMEERFRLALDASGQAVWDWDVPSGEVYFSPFWSEILEETDLPPRYETWETRLHPADREHVLASLLQHLAGETPRWSCDHRLLTGSGGWKWVLGQGRVVEWDQQGHPLRVVGAMRDITARKEVEEELQSTRSLNFTFAAAGLAWWEWDLARQQLIASSSLASMLGYAPEMLSGSADHWLSLIHPQDRESVGAALRACLDGLSREYSVTYRIKHKDGGYRSLKDQVLIAERDGAGKPLRLMGALREHEGASQ